MRLVCWWKGHDYYVGRVSPIDAVVADMEAPLTTYITVCARCGTHSMGAI